MKSSKNPFMAITVVFIVIASGLAIFFMFKKWHLDQITQSQQQAQSECLEVIQKLEADLEEMRAQLQTASEKSSEDDLFPTVFGTASSEDDANDLPADCEKVETQLKSFFQYLDRQRYMADRDIEGGSAGFFRDCAARLLADPPVNVAEMQDMFRLVKNVTHFYRVLGKDRLEVGKDILNAEDRVLEPALGLLYARIVDCRRPLPGDGAPLSIERIYDYAGYFLNTLGGRSYLLRRESRLRMLVTYYSILIVDIANDEKYNRYGIDLRPYIDYLFYDISNQKGLAYRERYLTRLTALKDKYM
ncbi:uncharacterized protein Dvar_19180 [Desulfosarcina variabilis str. Montpellier]|uniref:hypothetical protein n=1 Tax=Desulfosarcina variabilis TaxID=2300 RepID=UPI003AFA3369